VDIVAQGGSSCQASGISMNDLLISIGWFICYYILYFTCIRKDDWPSTIADFAHLHRLRFRWPALPCEDSWFGITSNAIYDALLGKKKKR
jgi:hypothetical protein